MKIYEIFDEEERMQVGVLLYYEKEGSYIIELPEYLDEWSAPLLFTAFVKKGVFTISREFSYMWVRERVIPSGRQNISSILATHKLKEYDEMKFLEIAEGRCSQDSLCIRRLDALPEFIRERQSRNLVDLVVLEENSLLCFFQNERVKKVKLDKLAGDSDIEKILANSDLFKSGKVGTGGYFAVFNDAIEIASAMLYEKGQTIPLTLSDFKAFVKQNVYDTSRSCEALECSRQNISYMIKQEQLTTLKEEVKGNLYLKGDVLMAKW